MEATPTEATPAQATPGQATPGQATPAGSAIPRWIVTALAVGITVCSIAWATDMFRAVGLLIYTEQYLAGMLALALPMLFLHVPASKGRERKGSVPWYDMVAAVMGVLAASFVAVRFPDLSEMTPERPTEGLIPAGIMLVLLVEGLRRTVGLVLVVVVVFFFLLTLVGHLVPGELVGRPVHLDQLVYYLGWESTGVLSIPMRIVTTIVVAFVLFGRVLFITGGSEFFTDISMVLMGRTRGGPAKIAVCASSLFGSISGSTVSNVVTTGVITIPLMREGGYKAHHAGAIEAVASTGGQLMPPVMGASAFLMAEFLQIPYTEVVLAALVPAILYYWGLFIQADLEAARSRIDRVPEDRIPAAGPVLKTGWFFPVPFVILVVALFWYNFTPERAALYAAASVVVCTVIFGYKGRRFGWRDALEVLRSTGITVADIFMIGAAAGIVIGSLNVSGLGFALTLSMVKIAGGHLIPLLLIAAVVCIVLGMGMPTVGVYVLLATLVAPALIEIGVNEKAAHLFILYFGMMSMITPPVAVGAFAAATLAESDPVRTGFAAMRFGWVAFVIPFLFVGSTTLLLEGDVMSIVLDIATAGAGVWLVCVGIMGYLTRRLGGLQRLAFIFAGLVLMVPAEAVDHGYWLSLVGACMGAALLVTEASARRRIRVGA